MISSGKCKKVIFSDISKKCLDKANNLMQEYVQSGVAFGVVSDGLKNLPKCDVALIAGMGGKEIISIINSAPNLPLTFVLQPMKNVQEVRRFLTQNGYKIDSDEMFISQGKFYDLIVASVGEETLDDDQIEFGKTNLKLKQNDFILYVNLQIKKQQTYLKNEGISDDAKSLIEDKIERLKRCLPYKNFMV
jgi:tRNA (adenine22-N1)-methyltransferase